jgi:hypothetical protein
MFDDFAVSVAPEDVDPGTTVVSRPLLLVVEDHVVSLPEHALEPDAFHQRFRSHSGTARRPP